MQLAAGVGVLSGVAIFVAPIAGTVIDRIGARATAVAAAVVFALGERLHATWFMPLVADLAPLALRGRYMATAGLSWWDGLARSPRRSARQLLAVSPALALIGAAAVAATTIELLRASEAALPVGVRAIPRPETH